MKIVNKLLTGGFYLLFFLVPLALFPKSSELFEFNKIIVLYSLTTLLVFLWVFKMVYAKKIIFKRTLLDLPLLLFLGSQTISTLLSIDQRTSLLGYYSRFNGGLVSTLCYSLLYWVYVSNLSGKNTLKLIKITFVSAVIVSVWGVLEHFGRSLSCLIFPGYGVFDVSCWVQDVQTRVFSTLGQPNWLAAWIITLIPMTWAYLVNESSWGKNKKIAVIKILLYIGLSALFFTTLTFTKSRSGMAAFFVLTVIFWLPTFMQMLIVKGSFKKKIGRLGLPFLALSALALVSLIFGTPWTSKLTVLLSKPVLTSTPTKTSGPALEVGGTESGKIRTIVWQGAIDIWKHYPIFGSGVETFAYSYYLYRPATHNMVSEWEYLYNKAHNEYLNFAATTGTLGLVTYLFLIAAAGAQIVNIRLRIKDFYRRIKLTPWNVAFLAGFSSILITNFFGFSVVPVSLFFFLLPAMAKTVSSDEDKEKDIKYGKISAIQAVIILASGVTALGVTYTVATYWYADYLYAKGVWLSDGGDYSQGRKNLLAAISYSPAEPFYWKDLAHSTTELAVAYQTEKKSDLAKNMAESAVTENQTAINLSPANVNMLRSASTNFIVLSPINSNLLVSANTVLEKASKLAPTDVKISYNLGLSYLRLGNYDSAITEIQRTVSLKPDYELAHYALALMYIDKKEVKNAKDELNFILTKINPQSRDARRELDELENR